MVGEKTANIHTEAQTNTLREGSKKTACRMIWVRPRLRGDIVTLQPFMLDLKLLLFMWMNVTIWNGVTHISCYFG